MMLLSDRRADEDDDNEKRDKEGVCTLVYKQ